MALGWFRRHQKKFLVFLTAFLMVTWGFGGYWTYFFSPQQTVGEISGVKVNESDFTQFVNRWQAAFPMQERDPKLLREMGWRQFVLAREAERRGLQASDGEVQTYIKLMRGGEENFNEIAFEAFLLERRITRHDFEKALRDRLLIMKLMGLVREEANLSDTAVWERYAQDNEKVKARYIAIKPENFIAAVSVTEEQIKKFYEDHKNDIADPVSNIAGYKLKEMVQAEVVLAKYADLEKIVKVADADIKQYYEDRKEDYKIEPKKEEPAKPEDKKEEAGKEPAKKEDAKPEPVKDTKPAEAKDPKAADPKTAAEKPKTEEAKPAEPQYKPFDEVKEEIRKNLAAKEARRVARELISKAEEGILSQLDQADQADFSKAAAPLAKEGLTYVKTKFFPRDDESAVPGIAGFADQTFSRKEWEPSRRLESPVGWYIFQTLARRLPEVQSLESVREQVVKDLKTDLAMKKAVETAQVCLKIANEKGLEAALAEAQKLVPKLPESKPAPPPDKEKEKTPAEKPKAPEPAVKIQETEHFTRPTSFGDGELHQFSTGIGGDRPHVAREVFALKGKAVGLAIEEKGEKACYLLQVADRKPADYAEFKKNIDQHRQRYVGEEQAAVTRAWMKELMENARLTGIGGDWDSRAEE